MVAKAKKLRRELLEAFAEDDKRVSQQRLKAAFEGYRVRQLISAHRQSTGSGFYSVRSSRLLSRVGPEHLRLALWFETAGTETDMNLMLEDACASVLQAAIRGRVARSETAKVVHAQGRRVRREPRTTRSPHASTEGREPVCDKVQEALGSILEDATHPMLVSPLHAASAEQKVKLPPVGAFSNRSSSLGFMSNLFTIHSG